MLKFFKQFFATNKSAAQTLSEEDLEGFSQKIHEICDNVEKKNLNYVNDTIESTSGHNNYKLVKAGAYFVKECVWTFNTHYASEFSKADYIKEFIIYCREVEDDFEKHNYDPDGVGGGTITDIMLNLSDTL